MFLLSVVKWFIWFQWTLEWGWLFFYVALLLLCYPSVSCIVLFKYEITFVHWWKQYSKEETIYWVFLWKDLWFFCRWKLFFLKIVASKWCITIFTKRWRVFLSDRFSIVADSYFFFVHREMGMISGLKSFNTIFGSLITYKWIIKVFYNTCFFVYHHHHHRDQIPLSILYIKRKFYKTFL